jgi:excinuclease UvrABC helicase subunit UvrB
MGETYRRRIIQEQFNEENGIIPQGASSKRLPLLGMNSERLSDGSWRQLVSFQHEGRGATPISVISA